MPKPAGWKHTPEARRKISQAQLGRKYPFKKRRPLSEETRRKISEAQKGKPRWTLEQRKEISRRLLKSGQKPPVGWGRKMPNITREAILKSVTGKANYLWKGDDVGYVGLHNWVKRNLGTPTKCEHCGKDGLTSQKIHWANTDHKYKRNLTDWIRLCGKCHSEYDKFFK